MSRVHWRLTLLALAATVFSLYPITSLFDSAAWFGTAVAVTGLVGVVGVIMRLVARSRLAVVVVQLVIVSYAVLARFALETFTWLLPTPRTLEQVGAFGVDALQTIQKHAAPAPLTPGVTFCLVVAAALVATAVDAAAATWKSPAAAGLPLLTAYLITAANGTEALSPTAFIPPVVIWLAMLHATARDRAGRWSSAPAGRPLDRDDASMGRHALWSLSAGAVRLGVLAVLVAIVLPALVPHFPPRYLTEGLGRSTGSGSSGTVGFSDTLDVSLSLKDTDQTPVLRYTTNGTGRVPLRVLATSSFSGGNWIPSRRGGAPLAPLPSGVSRKDYVMRVTSNSLRPPGLAAPYPVVAVNLDGTGWSVDPVTRDVRVAGLAREYEVTYADNAPIAAALREAGPPSGPDVQEDDLALPDSSRDLVTRWARDVTAGRTTALDKAIAIQDHLRDTSRYTYSLDLGDPPRDASGRIVEPVRAFYETRRGYCVQFATAMILMARAEGIPARMAIGFLPGVRDKDEYLVRAADAHAWPELYFEGYGWLRFEPTPGQRSGSPPPYTVLGSGSSTSGGGREAETDTATGSATTTPRRPDAQDLQQDTGGAAAATGTDRLVTLRTALTVIGVLVALLAIVLMPLTAQVVALRRRRSARDERELIEAEWEQLIGHLGDLGLPAPRGGTLRQWREHYTRAGHLDAAGTEALGRVTATLERARYDRPGRTSTDQVTAVRRDVRTIRRTVSRTRAWKARLRSVLWPSTGVDAWRRLRRRRGDGAGDRSLG